ncbi:NIF3 family protein, partial [Chlamydia psittaci C1/97]
MKVADLLVYLNDLLSPESFP